jgi:hypothetical protein
MLMTFADRARFAAPARPHRLRPGASSDMRLTAAVMYAQGLPTPYASSRPFRIADVDLEGPGESEVPVEVSAASTIVGIDLLEAKFPLARELGCTDCLLGNDSELVQKVKDLTRGGVDFAFEVTATTSAFKAAYDMLRKGGELIGIGLGSCDDMCQYPHAALVAEEKVIRGSVMGTAVAGMGLRQPWRGKAASVARARPPGSGSTRGARSSAIVRRSPHRSAASSAGSRCSGRRCGRRRPRSPPSSAASAEAPAPRRRIPSPPRSCRR